MAEQKPLDRTDYVDCGPPPHTPPEYLDVLSESAKREPIFHHPEFGSTREDFENMMAPEYWEVGASGRRYNREYVLAELAKRYADPQYRGIHSPPESSWEKKDFNCLKIAN